LRLDHSGTQPLVLLDGIHYAAMDLLQQQKFQFSSIPILTVKFPEFRSSRYPMVLDRYSLAPTGAGSHSPQLHALTHQCFSPALDYSLETSIGGQHPPPLQSQLNLDYGDSTTSPQIHLTQATGRATMGNQKMMTPKRGRGRPPGGGGSRGRSKTPGHGATVDGPPVKLKLKLNWGTSTPERNSTPAPQYEQPEEHDDLPAQPEQVTTRRGRKVKAPKHLDDIDYNPAYGLSSDQVDDDGDEYQPRASHQGSPSVFTVSQQQQTPKKSHGHSRKNAEKQFLYKVEEEDAPSSQTLVGYQPAYEPDSTEVYEILNSLRSTSKIHLDLPELSEAANSDKIKPYSAKFLTQLYIFCYRDRSWDLCDMIADTWIRAFHEMRSYGQRNPAYAYWRANPALERRKIKAIKHNTNPRNKHHIPSEFDPNPKDYELIATDPDLERNVTDIHTDLLNDLYERTNKDCGARILWADALALAGAKTEKIIEGFTKNGIELHKDLLLNIMQTSLRMCRRNLTLKIEESTEGAWCKRYHEHSKHEQPCYREKAWREGQEEEEETAQQEQYVPAQLTNEEQQQLADMQAFMEAEQGGDGGEQGTKRGFGDVDTGEMSPAKRTRFAEDVDAEGDSEE
jgi:hypothetical protein